MKGIAMLSRRDFIRTASGVTAGGFLASAVDNALWRPAGRIGS